MTTGRTRRGGFTLVEMLVVMALVAILFAIATAAYFAVIPGQTGQATDATLDKLHSKLQQRWSAVVEQAKKEVRARNLGLADPRAYDSLLRITGGDAERALAVWTYMRLKNEFPTTFAEAGGPGPTPTDLIFTVGSDSVSLPARKQFTAVVDAASGTPSVEEQSAALIYAALMTTATAGVSTESDGLEQQTADSPAGRVFRDSYGKPIAFARMAYSPELNSPPYVRPGAGSNLDPLDQRAKLQSSGWSSSLTTFWDAIKANHLPGCDVPVTYDGTKSWTPTLVSAGPDNKFADAGGSMLNGTGVAADNRLSFRRRAGQKGN